MKKIVVLSGAGVSAESGVPTFRDANGLWEGHDVMEVATPEGFAKNPGLVLEFYNQRRASLKSVEPNKAHHLIKKLEAYFEVIVITQNVDDLHERAGSSNIIHLHGELRKVRSTLDPQHVKYWEKDINLGDKCPRGGQLRPHIVWFGEDVPMIETAAKACSNADIIIIVGTSMQVYPAASLYQFAPAQTPIYYIDPNAKENIMGLPAQRIKTITDKATTGMAALYQELQMNYK
ncbi:MAG: NAD-dependent deacylase [Saprospiraceae bacterium]|nr:NAD-dependent deacylase [Saprospiraceae bacterium]